MRPRAELAIAASTCPALAPGPFAPRERCHGRPSFPPTPPSPTTPSLTGPRLHSTRRNEQLGEDRLREDWASERLPGAEDSELAGVDIGSSRLWKKRGSVARPHSPMHEQRSNASSRNASRPASRSTGRSAEAPLDGGAEPPAAGPAGAPSESDAVLMMPPPLSKPPVRRRQE